MFTGFVHFAAVLTLQTKPQGINNTNITTNITTATTGTDTTDAAIATATATAIAAATVFAVSVVVAVKGFSEEGEAGIGPCNRLSNPSSRRGAALKGGACEERPRLTL